MRVLVVGRSLQVATAIGQAFETDRHQTTLCHSVTPHETLAHLRHADRCDAVVFLCDSGNVTLQLLTPASPGGAGEVNNVGGASARRSRSISYRRSSETGTVRFSEGDCPRFGTSWPRFATERRGISHSTGEDEGEGESENSTSFDGVSLPRFRSLLQRRLPDSATPRQGNDLPVLVIGGHGPTWIGCLDAGADDYLSVPYEIPVLLARLRAFVRRFRLSVLSSRLEVGDLSLDPATRAVQRAGKPIELTLREYGLLEYLMRHAGEICTHKVLLEKAWGYRHKFGKNIDRLREKIDAKFETKLIHTVRGVGYRLSVGG